MVIYIPEGSPIDRTRPKGFDYGTYSYLQKMGIQVLE